MLIEAAKGGHFDIMNMLLDWPTYAERVGATGEANLSSSQPIAAEKTDKTNKVKIDGFLIQRVSWPPLTLIRFD